MYRWGHLLAAAPLLLIGEAVAAPTVERQGNRVLVTGEQYRATFVPESAGFAIELKGADGQYRAAAAGPAAYSLTYFAGNEFAATGLRATWAEEQTPEAVVIGQQVPLDALTGIALDLHCLCTNSGVLLGARLVERTPTGQGVLWSPPRIALKPPDWSGYLFWGPDGKAHEGLIADLAPMPAYAGVSAWGPVGDTVSALSAQDPALIVRSAAWGTDLGAIYLQYPARWTGASMFLQRHTPGAMYLYAGYSPAGNAREPLWAWLAPFPRADAPTAAARVEALVKEGEKLVGAFRPISKAVPEDWLRPVPDFPAALRHAQPVTDVNEAAVFTINEDINSDYGVNLAKKVGSDCCIRAWFKWAQRPPVEQWQGLPPQVHQLGALFGGGITCSALYDNENGITQEQLLDMATRGPAGQLIDAWETPGIRHGSLSSPAYLDYLFRWCREQIDAGVDYLFMDEHTAAIGGLEGYDDHSLADFRQYLLHDCPQTQGWVPDDARWLSDYKIPLTDPPICPDGTMGTFDYRAYMRAKGVIDNPNVGTNPLIVLWQQFRGWRDDRAWKTLTDHIRAYGKEQGRTVLISANGIARYVDLQVLGVWDQWAAQNGRIDLSANQLPYWRSLVVRGRNVAERRVPVVLFHDWGFGDVPFPWMAVPSAERELWMRTRAAEIYAAGGFFAFPVLGPFGCDCSRDGTLPLIAKLTAFYQRNRDLYLRGKYLGSEALQSPTANLSLAAWWSDEPRGVVLHVINRNARDGVLQPQRNVVVKLPLGRAPDKVTVISPDWEGEREGSFRIAGNEPEITLPEVQAYAVVILHCAGDVDLSRLTDPNRVVTNNRWERPNRSEFRVLPGGVIEHADDLNGMIQGMLHTEMRNPPTFLVNVATEGKLLIHVQGVASAGARFEYRVDGDTKQTLDLPDRDGKNDGSAPEYDKIFSFPIPVGRHRLTLDNVGGDWANVTWFEFQGKLAEA